MFIKKFEAIFSPLFRIVAWIVVSQGSRKAEKLQVRLSPAVRVINIRKMGSLGAGVSTDWCII